MLTLTSPVCEYGGLTHSTSVDEINLAWTAELPKLHIRSWVSIKSSPVRNTGVPPVIGPAFSPKDEESVAQC